MSDNRWEPWVTFRDMRQQLIPIYEPPCKGCQFWRPHIRYYKNGEFDGITCCTADDMYSDFSCFEETAETSVGKNDSKS